MVPQTFISKYQNTVIDATIGTRIFPSVKLAQMALESNWGKSIISNNAFGIKAAGVIGPYWKGDTVSAKTGEYIKGAYVTTGADFRAYKSVADSIKDHTYFLKTNNRYAKVFQAQTPQAQALELQNAGYATDPGYANKLISLINQYNLTDLDSKKKLRAVLRPTVFILIALIAAYLIYRIWTK